MSSPTSRAAYAPTNAKAPAKPSTTAPHAHSIPRPRDVHASDAQSEQHSQPTASTTSSDTQISTPNCPGPSRSTKSAATRKPASRATLACDHSTASPSTARSPPPHSSGTTAPTWSTYSKSFTHQTTSN